MHMQLYFNVLLNTIFFLLFTVLSQTLLNVAVYSINITVSFFLIRDTCAENVNMTSIAYNGEKCTVGRPRNITDSARKRLKEERDIHSPFYFRDRHMNDGRKRNEN